jgi:hypothetical protein
MLIVSRNLLLVMMAALALSGCGSKEPQGSSAPSSAKGPTRKSADPGQAALLRNMVGAVVAGKTTDVPVQVRFELRQRPDVGQPLDIDLVIIPSSDAVDQFSGTVQADDGLELISGAQIPATQRPAAGVAITHSIRVLPKRDGIFTFNAVLSVDYGGQTATQTYSMPLISGSGITDLPSAVPDKSAKPPGGAAKGAASAAH